MHSLSLCACAVWGCCRSSVGRRSAFDIGASGRTTLPSGSCGHADHQSVDISRRVDLVGRRGLLDLFVWRDVCQTPKPPHDHQKRGGVRRPSYFHTNRDVAELLQRTIFPSMQYLLQYSNSSNPVCTFATTTPSASAAGAPQFFRDDAIAPRHSGDGLRNERSSAGRLPPHQAPTSTHTRASWRNPRFQPSPATTTMMPCATSSLDSDRS